MEKSILIQNGYEVIKELVVIGKISPCQYGIKVKAGNGYVVQLITIEEFNSIIEDARAKGYDVFDFTDF